jgi:nucleolar protein 58
MLVLFETPAGFALFKCLQDGKLSNADDIFEAFSTPEKANQTYEYKILDVASTKSTPPPLSHIE